MDDPFQQEREQHEKEEHEKALKEDEDIEE